MPVPETTRSNIWKLTLEIEDTADLVAFIADPDGTEWPLVDDYETMYRALRRFFFGVHLIDLPTGGRGRIVKVSLEEPEDEEFLTERKFRNQVTGEREAPVLRAELPQDAAAALGMVLSAVRYLEVTAKGRRDGLGGVHPGRVAVDMLRDVAYSFDDSELPARWDDILEDLEAQAEHKWQARKQLGMLEPRWTPANWRPA